MTRPPTRLELERLLAALREKQARADRRRVETQRAEIVAGCRSLYGFIEEFWHTLAPARPFVGG